ncbi:MAG: tRNA1(Val) (adenine(37)-N6)-methyltransferase [Defluviitaleaceae bacterium]|nr:tRNA1(Val) (adenine(37)-N6)-methyltransferase [Defluviitaleaceae bacterium]
MDNFVKENERVDDLQLNGLVIIQNPGKFLFGIDAVMLSDFATVAKGERALDLGTGTGVIPILLSAKGRGSYYAGVDIQEEMVDMARRSVALNVSCGALVKGTVEIEVGDLRDLSGTYKPSSFDLITCNPPYIKAGEGLVNETDARAVSRHEIACTLADVVCAAARLLRPGGRFAMVHKPHRLAECFELMRLYGLEPKRLRFVHATVHKEPSLCLIEATRGGGAFLKVMPPIIIG